MKKLLIILIPIIALSGCVSKSTVEDYAQRAYPECTNHQVQKHIAFLEGQSEVAITCDGKTRAISIKCSIGVGIFTSDTVCHENN